jgi:hypothetical protein
LRRKDVKKQFLVMLFGDVPLTVSMRLFEVFATEFPSVADFVLAAKRNCYQELARRCQRLESRLIIDGACEASFRTSPETVVVSIHDAILTTETEAESVADLIRCAFKRFGVTPSLEISAAAR